MVALYTFAQEREVERMKIFGQMMGADFEDDVKKTTTHAPKRIIQREGDFTMFKHPSEYAKMSKEERQQLTEQMMGAHRQAMRKIPKQMGRG